MRTIPARGPTSPYASLDALFRASKMHVRVHGVIPRIVTVVSSSPFIILVLMAHSGPRPEAVEQKGIDFHAGYSTKRREFQRCPTNGSRSPVNSLVNALESLRKESVIELINRVKYFIRIISLEKKNAQDPC